MADDDNEADALRQQADDAFNDRDWNQALRLYKRLVAHPGLRDIDRPDVYWFYATCFVKLGDIDSAIEQFQLGGWSEDQYGSQLDLPQQETEDDFDLACDAYVAGNYKFSAELLEKLVADGYGDANRKKEVHWNLAMAYERLGRNDDALEQFKAGGYTEAEYGPALQQLTAADTPATDGAGPASPAGTVDTQFDLGCDAYTAGNYQLAIDTFLPLRAHADVPADVRKQIEWNLAMCYFHLNQDDTGRQHMTDGGFSEADYKEDYERVVGAR